MEAAITNLILTLLLLLCIGTLLTLWLKNRRLKKKVKKLRQGTYPLSLLDKILIALRLKVPPRPPHGGFKKGDVNIRVW
jgi:hypothetical protein